MLHSAVKQGCSLSARDARIPLYRSFESSVSLLHPSEPIILRRPLLGWFSCWRCCCGSWCWLLRLSRMLLHTAAAAAARVGSPAQVTVLQERCIRLGNSCSEA